MKYFPSHLLLPPTFLFGRRDEVEVEDAVDCDVLLHLVVKLPVPHDVGLHVVPGNVFLVAKATLEIAGYGQSVSK